MMETTLCQAYEHDAGECKCPPECTCHSVHAGEEKCSGTEQPAMTAAVSKPEIILDPDNPEKTLQELAEAAKKLTPEQIEANRQRLLQTARKDKRPVPTRTRNVRGDEYGLSQFVNVLIVQTPHSVRIELHRATKQEYDYFCSIFLPTNPNAKIELRKRDFRREERGDHTIVVRRFLREEAKKRGEFPT